MIQPTEEDSPAPLGEQLAFLKRPEILNSFGVTFFWQLGYAMLYAYIAPFLLNVTTMSERQVSFVGDHDFLHHALPSLYGLSENIKRLKLHK